MNNEISQYFSKSDGSTIATDNDLKSLSTGTVVKNINSKESYKKIAVNVFDKQNDFITNADASRKFALKSEAVKSINGDGSSTTIAYQMADGTNKSFVTKDTTYSAGTGLSLNGNSFNINIPNYKMSDGTNPDETYIMTLDKSQNACHPSGYTVGRLVEMINNSGGSGAFKEAHMSGGMGGYRISVVGGVTYLEQWFRCHPGSGLNGPETFTPGYHDYPYGKYVSCVLVAGPTGYNSSYDHYAPDHCDDISWTTEGFSYDSHEGNGLGMCCYVFGIMKETSGGGSSGGGSSGGGSSGGGSETPTTHLKTYSVPSSDLVKQGSVATGNGFTDEEVFNYIKRKDPGAVSLVNFRTEEITPASIIRVTSITYYTTTA